MRKTVIFGGTFDPPHEGHLNLLESVMAHGYDRAIVIPDCIPPHKTRDTAEDDFARRFELTRRMFSGMDNVTVSDIEYKRGGKSYTSDTLCQIQKLYPDDKLYLLMGSDMLLSIEKWHEFKNILQSVTVISAARTRQDSKKIHEFKNYLEKNYKCDIIIYDIDIVELSSTELRSELILRIKAHNSAHLSPERLEHVNSVANYAVKLASIHGINQHAAYTAALAHDCTKYLDNDEQLEYCRKNGIELTDDDIASPKVLHQITGAHFAEHTLGMTDGDQLNAIRWHTTGRENMSRLEKLICLADSIEPLREYPGVDRMREIAGISIDRALLMSFDRLISYVRERGLHMNRQTLKAREYLRKEISMEEVKTILETAVKTLYKKQGREIKILKVDDVTVMADYFVICTGMSSTQVNALSGEVEFELSKLGIEPLHTEGYGNSPWVLLDYGSVIIHVFYKDARDYYKLERLWADGKEIPLSDFVDDMQEDTPDEI